MKAASFDVTVSLNGKKYTGTGKSISDALGTIKVRNPKGRAIVSVKHGKNVKDRVLLGPQLFRLFMGQGLMREVALKQVSSLFDGV